MDDGWMDGWMSKNVSFDFFPSALPLSKQRGKYPHLIHPIPIFSVFLESTSEWSLGKLPRDGFKHPNEKGE
jgi:hypothetical protein